MHISATMKKIWTVLLVAVILSGCGRVTGSAEKESPAHHRPSDGFQNPHLQPGKRGLFRYLKMRYFGGEDFADYAATAHRVETVRPDPAQINNPGERPQVTSIGHATVLIQYRGMAILTDPMFSDRASPVNFAGPKRVNPPALSIAELPPIDLVVISHNHYDHLDTRSVRQLGGEPLWLVPLGLRKWFLDNGIPGDRVVELDWWDSYRYLKSVVTATPAQHWSARGIWDRYETLWASWMVQLDDFTFWYSGDTGYNPYQFKEIGRRFPQVDVGLITIGAYEPRWFMKDMHVNPEEAVQIHLDIQARRSFGIQWGTFPLTAEPIDEPPKRLREAVRGRNIAPEQFVPLQIGETRIIDL